MHRISMLKTTGFVGSAPAQLWNHGVAVGYFATVGPVRVVRDIVRYCCMEGGTMGASPERIQAGSRVSLRDVQTALLEEPDPIDESLALVAGQAPALEKKPEGAVTDPLAKKKTSNVRFAMPKEEHFRGVELSATNKPLTKDDTDHLERSAQTLLDLLESDELKSVRVCLQFEFYRDEEIYDELTAKVVAGMMENDSDAALIESFEKMASKASIQERLLMLSTADAHSCSIEDARSTIKSFEQKIEKRQGKPTVDNVKTITRYQLAIADILIAIEASEQKEGPTQKSWTNAVEKKELTPFLQQFRRIVEQGESAEVCTYIRNLRSLNVLRSLESFLAQRFYSPVFIDEVKATIEKRAKEQQQLADAGHTTSARFITTTLSQQVRRVQAYLRAKEYERAVKYIQAQKNLEVCQQIKEYLEQTGLSETCLSAVKERIQKL